MKHGIICPTQHLQDFASLSRFHLILPHLHKDHPDYKSFYVERARLGDFVMMDNSFFELHETGEVLSHEFLISEANDMGCSEVVAPEVLGDVSGSVKELEEFLYQSSKLKSRVPVAAVLQGSTLDELVQYFFELNENYSDDISCIAIPFALDFHHNDSALEESHTMRRVINRQKLITAINDKINWDNNNTEETITPIPVHLLGLADPVELLAYKNISWIRSNDSSTAYIHGSNNILITDKGLPGEKIKAKVDFNEYIYDGGKIGKIHRNIQKVLSFCSK